VVVRDITLPTRVTKRKCVNRETSPELRVNDSSPSNAEVKNEWKFTLTPSVMPFLCDAKLTVTSYLERIT
jgi:hypothetical protein